MIPWNFNVRSQNVGTPRPVRQISLHRSKAPGHDHCPHPSVSRLMALGNRPVGGSGGFLRVPRLAVGHQTLCCSDPLTFYLGKIFFLLRIRFYPPFLDVWLTYCYSYNFKITNKFTPFWVGYFFLVPPQPFAPLKISVLKGNFYM